MDCEMTAIAKVDGERKGDDCNGGQYGRRPKKNRQHSSKDPHWQSEGQQPHYKQEQVERRPPNGHPYQSNHPYNRVEDQNQYTGETETVYPLQPSHPDQHYSELQSRPWVLRPYSNGGSPPPYNSGKPEIITEPSNAFHRNVPGSHLMNQEQMSNNVQQLTRPQYSPYRAERPYNLVMPSDAFMRIYPNLGGQNLLTGGAPQQPSIREEPPSYESGSPQNAIGSTGGFIRGRDPNPEVQSLPTQGAQVLTRPWIPQNVPYSDQQPPYDRGIPQIMIDPADAFLRGNPNQRGPFPLTGGGQDLAKPWNPQQVPWPPQQGTLADEQSSGDLGRLRVASDSVDPQLRRNLQNAEQALDSGGTQNLTGPWIPQESPYKNDRYPNVPERPRIPIGPSDAFIRPGYSGDSSSPPETAQGLIRPWIPQEMSNTYGQPPHYLEMPQAAIGPTESFTGRNTHSADQSPSSLSSQRLAPQQPLSREGQSSYVTSDEPDITNYPANSFQKNNSEKGFPRTSEAPLYGLPSNNQFPSPNFQRAAAISESQQLPIGPEAQSRYKGESSHDYQGLLGIRSYGSTPYRGIAVPPGQEIEPGRQENTRAAVWPYGSPERSSPYGRMATSSEYEQSVEPPGIGQTVENSMTHEYPTNYQRGPMLPPATHQGIDPRLRFHAGGMYAEIDPTKLFRARTGGVRDLGHDGLSVEAGPDKAPLPQSPSPADPRIADSRIQFPNAVVDVREGGRKIETDPFQMFGSHNGDGASFELPYQKPMEGFPRRGENQVDFSPSRAQQTVQDVAPTAILGARPLEASMNLPQIPSLLGQELTYGPPPVHGGKNYELDFSKLFRQGIDGQIGFKLPNQGSAEEPIMPNTYQVALSSPRVPSEVPSIATRMEGSLNSPRIDLTSGNELAKSGVDPQTPSGISSADQGDNKNVIDPFKMFKKLSVDPSGSAVTSAEISEFPGVDQGSLGPKSSNSAINIHAFGKNVEIDPTKLFRTRTGGSGVELSREGFKVESNSKGASTAKAEVDSGDSKPVEGRRSEIDPSKMSKVHSSGNEGAKAESQPKGTWGVELQPSAELGVENTGSISADARTDGKPLEVDQSKLFKARTEGRTESPSDILPEETPISPDSHQVELTAPKLQVDAPKISSNATLETKPLGVSIDPSRSTVATEQTAEFSGDQGSSDSKSSNSAINIHAFGKNVGIDPAKLFKTRAGGGVKLSRGGVKIESDSRGASAVKEEVDGSGSNSADTGQTEGNKLEINSSESFKNGTGGGAEDRDSHQVQLMDEGVQYNPANLNESSQSQEDKKSV
ncbi:hypothetical protein Aperf_G00000057106 [Anoplocephala perfoliata]